jgi:regulator of sigma E protease
MDIISLLLRLSLALIAFSILIITHELGHFLVAKLSGVKVYEFGIGFPPAFKKIVTKSGMIYSLNALPFGGFVRIKGEDGSEAGADSFTEAKLYKKIFILLAGVMVNFMTAFMIIFILFKIGFPDILPANIPIDNINHAQRLSSGKVVVGYIVDGSVAQKSGLKNGDDIVSINSKNIDQVDDLFSATKELRGKNIDLRYNRDGQEHVVKITLEDKDSAALGVSPITFDSIRYPWKESFIATNQLIYNITASTFKSIGALFSPSSQHRQDSLSNVTGPIGIVNVFIQSIDYGVSIIMVLIASLALSLAIMNSLPIPALDGGRVLIVLLESLGIKTNQRILGIIYSLSFLILIGLMLIVSVQDISKL